MSVIDRSAAGRFVRLAADRLEGEWVLIGGALLPLLGIPGRTTLDIDIAGPADAGPGASLALMEIAERVGLPVEAVNQAGAFFLRRIDGWQDHLLPVRRGRRASILRPDATLFVLLKLPRLTESDLSDCLAYLGYSCRNAQPPDAPALLAALRKARRQKSDPGRRKRLGLLRAAVAGCQGTG
jgi:hypothetical protein